MLIKMVIPNADSDQWQKFFGYAENGMADANLQDIVEYFGIDADSKFESLITSYGMENACRVESWWYSINEFEFILISPSIKHKNAFTEFLVSCGALNISEESNFDW